MAVIKVVDTIQLPFVKINLLKADGHAETMEDIPDFMTKVEYTAMSTKKDDGGPDRVFEVGLSFTNTLYEIPEHLKYVAQDYVEKTIKFHLQAYCSQYANKPGNYEVKFELGHTQMSRIMTLFGASRTPSPLKLEYGVGGVPTLKFGIGRDIIVFIAPKHQELKLYHEKGFMGVLDMIADNEPVIEGSINIFGEPCRVHVWRTYNNKLFNEHADKGIVHNEIAIALNQHNALIEALGGWGSLQLFETNTDRLLKAAI